MKKAAQARQIAILGSTGSIGRQALEVVDANPDHFQVSVLTANASAELLIDQAKKYRPNTVVIVDEEQWEPVRDALWDEGIKVFAGAKSLEDVVTLEEVDVVLTAIVGFAGLKSTIAAIEAGKPIALANKETLVVAGDLITRLAQEKAVNIYPVDSEHSAIFQCMVGEWENPIEKIILTASGGPFRGKNREELQDVGRQQALKHPNWEMGAKITIDSATLMNKGLEVIEAKWLFGLKPEQIEVVVHPQSIIHSMVQFRDGSLKAQLGLPDMKLPIQYALAYPQRVANDFPRLDFATCRNLTFEEPDLETFGCLRLAFEALQKGGNAACALNAANEVAVEAFLQNSLRFLDIARVNEETMQRVRFMARPTLDDYLETDRHAREIAAGLIERK